MLAQVGRAVTRSLQCFRHVPLKLQSRNTHIVKHAKVIPPTPPGQFQRPPTEKQELQMYEFVDEDIVNEYPPVKVILTKSVDGVGRRGDIVSVPSLEFHESLFPSGAAIYATPYDLRLLEEQKRAGAFSTLEAEDVVSFEHKKFARVLNSTIVKITMTFDQQWTLDKWHLRVNLRRAGFIVDEENIVLPAEEVSGPNKNLQGKLVTFYVRHTQHCIVPALGRIEQTSSKGHQLIIAAAAASSEHAAKDGAMATKPTAPPIYFSVEPITGKDDEIRALMTSRQRQQQQEPPGEKGK